MVELNSDFIELGEQKVDVSWNGEKLKNENYSRYMRSDKGIINNVTLGFALDTDINCGNEMTNVKSFRTLISENEQQNELELFENEHICCMENALKRVVGGINKLSQ